MVAISRILSFLMGGLPAAALALGKIQVENAAVGQKTLIITVDDSILTPDLAKLKIEGYEIEQAVFIDEKSDAPIQLSPHFIDMTAPGNGRILDFLPTPGLLVLDWPPSISPIPAMSSVIPPSAAFSGRWSRWRAAPSPACSGASGP